MKILIVYASQTGTAKECVNLLQRECDGLEVVACNLADEKETGNGNCFNPTEFDAVIVGGSVRMGKLHHRLSAFLSDSEQDLLNRPLGLFLCCGNSRDLEEYFQRLFSEALVSHAFLTTCFGGSLDLKRFRGLERLAVRFLRAFIVHGSEQDHDEGQYEPRLPAILPENISRMASALRIALTEK